MKTKQKILNALLAAGVVINMVIVILAQKHRIHWLEQEIRHQQAQQAQLDYLVHCFGTNDANGGGIYWSVSEMIHDK